MLTHSLLPLITPPSQPKPKPPKYSLYGLLTLSFHHLLLLSFFVSVEKVSAYSGLKQEHSLLHKMLLFFEVFFAFTFLYTMPNRENEAAIEHLGLVTANVVVSNMMISMVDSTTMIVTIVLWVLVFVLDLIFLAKDASHQLWEKRLYWLPKSEETLEDQIRIAEDALERARDLRSLTHVFYQEAKQRIDESNEKFYYAREILSQKRALLLQEKKELEAKLATKKKDLETRMEQESDANRKLIQAQLEQEDLLLAQKKKDIETKMENETEEKKNEALEQLNEEVDRLAKKKIEMEKKLNEEDEARSREIEAELRKEEIRLRKQNKSNT